MHEVQVQVQVQSSVQHGPNKHFEVH